MKLLNRTTLDAKNTDSLRAALYLRVSTGRQAENDLSIPDQRRQAQEFCKARGWQVVIEFVDAGLSGTDDRRPELQRLLDLAAGGDSPFDVVVVHSFSRFARDHFALEYHVRRLRKNRVKLVSITQDLGDDPMSVMVRQVFALFDEYQSKENAKHVLRAMQENARQGFWNGAAAPYGYAIVAAEQRGAKTKKRLAIDAVEAEVVRLMFRLVHEGNGTSGPLGVKALACHLNERGYRTRRGARWGIGPLHALLTSPTYKGEYRFNRKVWKTKEEKPEADQIMVPVDPIIDPALFDAVQARLKSRNPKQTPPRVVTGTASRMAPTRRSKTASHRSRPNAIKRRPQKTAPSLSFSRKPESPKRKSAPSPPSCERTSPTAPSRSAAPICALSSTKLKSMTQKSASTGGRTFWSGL